jgi:excinuclease UvrABC nuclease subunit
VSEGNGNEELSRAERIAQQRRELPDSPGVYLFHAADGETLYVGKARSNSRAAAASSIFASSSSSTRR